MKKIHLILTCLISFQLTISFSLGQEVMLKGTVTDKKSGEPIYSATISTERKQNTTISDFDGQFSLPVNWNDTIFVQFIGMKTQKILVTSNPIHIQLEEIEPIETEFGPPETPIKPTPLSVQSVSKKELKGKKRRKVQTN